jgi:uncharacterized protein (TIGR02453 family)
MIDCATIDFLSEAAVNDKSDWMQDNRSRLTQARNNLVELTARLISDAGFIDDRIREMNPDPRKCVDKAQFLRGDGMIALRVSPMKNAAAVYFMSVSGRGSFSGGGALHPPPRLARILRQTIASHTGKWRGIVEGPVFRKYFPHGLNDGRDTSAPGFVKNHDALDFFNLKHFGACRTIPNELLASIHLVDETVKSFAAARPLVDYINRSTTKLA